MLSLVAAALVAFVCHALPEFAVPTETQNSYSMMFSLDAINTFFQAVAPMVIEQILEISVSDFSGSASTAIGTIDYAITDISFQALDFGIFEFGLDADTSVASCVFGNGTAELVFAYEYQLLSWPYTSEEGSGSVGVDGLDTEMGATLTKDKDLGTIVVALEYSTVTLGDFTLHLDGTILAALVDTFEAIFADEITAYLGDLLTDFLTNAMAELLGGANLFAIEQCSGEICTDLRLASDVYIADTYATERTGGTVYLPDAQNLYEAPSDYTNMPTSVNDRMMQMLLGPPTFTSYFSALFAGGLLAPFTAAPDADASDALAALLNADTVAAAFPEFAAAAPGSACALSVEPTAAPTAEIFYSSIQVTFAATVALAPYDAAADEVGAALVTFDATVTTAATLDFDGADPDAAQVDCSGWLAFDFAAYSAAAAVAASEIGSVALTDNLTDWLADAFVEAAARGAWEPALAQNKLYVVVFPSFYCTDRAIVYSPDYYAMTYDIAPEF
eukprot:gnl/Chilomastix_cuspidata/1319.p1 GENE.gnl/Chilomastix_cuspidata/1319~~gnl/Chilomastix_cuspidata/1319.p1  ORF type:complete len:560 (-),score=223.94 gnl/Chilomastix_cuspidata/1319:52-1560(-)